MNEDLQCLVLNEYFPSDYTYYVENMNIDPQDYGNFDCTVRIKAPFGAVELSHRWLADFSELTKTSWRDVKHEISAARFQFERDLVCNYGGSKIKHGVLAGRCAAYLKLRVKKYSYGSEADLDSLAARGFLTVINMSFSHNHLLLVSSSTFSNSYRPKHEICLLFMNYCRSGRDLCDFIFATSLTIMLYFRNVS